MMKIYGRTSSSRSSTEVGTECEANGEREGEGHRILHMHRGKGTTELLMAEEEGKGAKAEAGALSDFFSACYAHCIER